jgi:predicted PurR-regulated permease PerM
VKSRSKNELFRTVATASAAQVIIAVAGVMAVCYVAKLPLVVLLVAALVAFALAPLVEQLDRLHIPRWAGSFIAVVLLIGCLYGLMYFSYSRAIDFLHDLPKYTEKIRESTVRFRKEAEQIQRTTERVLPDATDGRQSISVKPQTGWTDWFTRSGLSEFLVSISFIPFLVYFMLSWKDRMRDASVRLFDPQNRRNVYATLGGIAQMLRAFIVGNLICGLFISAISTAVFGFLDLPYFYFLGFISGFLSLVPYLGVVLAIVPPLAAGFGELDGGSMVALAVIIVGLHVFAINVLFPKVIGKRLRLNPLIVTIALLLWGWLWGAMGLILAVPITGAMKIIFDHIESLRPFGAWMED